MRTKIIAGNWKMNLKRSAAIELAAGLASSFADAEVVDVAVCPPFVYLDAVMGAVDLAVNLRYPPARASSGVLHQLLQIGVPAVISDVLHWRDYPDAAVARVPPGPEEAEHEVLAQALGRWLIDPERRAAAASVPGRTSGRSAESAPVPTPASRPKTRSPP